MLCFCQQKLIAYCSSAAGKASPYEEEEIVFLLSVAGVIRKEPMLLHLFLPSHEHSWTVALLNPSLGMKVPVKNTLFETAKIDPHIKRISLVQDLNPSGSQSADKSTELSAIKSISEYNCANCDCSENETFILFDAILRYFDSAVSNAVHLITTHDLYLPFSLKL